MSDCARWILILNFTVRSRTIQPVLYLIPYRPAQIWPVPNPVPRRPRGRSWIRPVLDPSWTRRDPSGPARLGAVPGFDPGVSRVKITSPGPRTWVGFPRVLLRIGKRK